MKHSKVQVFELSFLLNYKYRKSANNGCSFKIHTHDDIYTKTRTVLIYAHKIQNSLQLIINLLYVYLQISKQLLKFKKIYKSKV